MIQITLLHFHRENDRRYLTTLKTPTNLCGIDDTSLKKQV